MPERLPAPFYDEALAKVKEMNRQRTMKQHVRYRLTRLRWNLGWWMDPKHNARRVKWNYQRWSRGWSDRDTWGFDTFLATIIRDGLRHLADIAHGWPDGLYKSFDEYVAELRSIADGFDHYLKVQEYVETCSCCEPRCFGTDECVIIREAFEKFSTLFPALWD